MIDIRVLVADRIRQPPLSLIALDYTSGQTEALNELYAPAKLESSCNNEVDASLASTRETDDYCRDQTG